MTSLLTPSPADGRPAEPAWQHPQAQVLPPCDTGLKASWEACSTEAEGRMAGARQEIAIEPPGAGSAAASGTQRLEGPLNTGALEARVASLRMLSASRERDRGPTLRRPAGVGPTPQDHRSSPPAAWELAREVASQLQVSERQLADHWHVRIKLQDRHLPDTEVMLSRAGNRLDVSFRTSSSEALRLIGNGLADLRPMLERSSGCFVEITLDFAAKADEASAHGR